MNNEELKSAKILVVDDEWANIELLKMLLKRWGVLDWRYIDEKNFSLGS